ncbi:MAG TPA: aldo/keto reductase [Blastocatellia bacterium]|nr:aldo/keto reductase [Blastocatellia bacterium]
MSSIGLGSYLGGADERTDAAYQAAVVRALELGCNIFDTAANYRFQRSERNFGEALADLFSRGTVSREEVIITTKGGYLPFDNHQPRSQQEMMSYLEETFIKPGVCEWSDFVQGSHCMTPGYLAHQLDQSLRNLKLEGVDVYYLHNPESQLAEVSRAEFYQRLQRAFEFLETMVEAGKISFYGTATWNGYRVPERNQEYLSLEEIVRMARTVAGQDHHFRVVQLPVNLAMIEAFTQPNQQVGPETRTFLQAAAELGITVMSSASILQARLAQGLPAIVGDNLKGLRTDAQRAIQFTRSTPGITTALIGMSKIPHVEENLEVARIAPAPPNDYLKLFNQV